MVQTSKNTSGKRTARRNRSALRLPVAVLLISLTLVGGRSLLSPGQGAEAPMLPEPVPAVTQTPSPTPVPTPFPVPTSLPARGTHPSAPYDYTVPVPASDPAEASWFSDAAFLGDSLTDGLLLYSGIRGADNLAYKGLTVQSIRTDKVIKTDSGKVTPLEALGTKTYGKVYLLLGVNELGWYNDQRFYKAYGELLDLVRDAQPDAQIYLQTLLPVTAEKSASHAYLTNDKVETYNALIAELAAEKEVYLVDLHAAFAGDDGALCPEESTDGVHLTKSAYQRWLEVLRTHTVSE